MTFFRLAQNLTRVISDIQGLREAVKVEAFNKKFWFLCQHWLAARQGPQQRFRDLITSIPEIRFVASALKKVPAEKLCLLFKVCFFAFTGVP